MNKFARSLLVVVALATLGGVVTEGVVLNQTKASLRTTRHRVSAAEDAVSEVELQLSNSKSALGRKIDAITPALEEIENRVSGLEGAIGSSYGYTDDLSARIDAIDASVRGLAVNVSQVFGDIRSLSDCTENIASALRGYSNSLFSC